MCAVDYSLVLYASQTKNLPHFLKDRFAIVRLGPSSFLHDYLRVLTE